MEPNPYESPMEPGEKRPSLWTDETVSGWIIWVLVIVSIFGTVIALLLPAVRS